MRAGKQTAICAHAINTAVLVQPHLGEHVPEELVVHNPEGGARSIDEACNCCIHISLGHCPFAGVHCQLCTQLNGHLLLLLMLLTCLLCSCPAASSLLQAALCPSERRQFCHCCDYVLDFCRVALHAAIPNPSVGVAA